MNGLEFIAIAFMLTGTIFYFLSKKENENIQITYFNLIEDFSLFKCSATYNNNSYEFCISVDQIVETISMKNKVSIANESIRVNKIFIPIYQALNDDEFIGESIRIHCFLHKTGLFVPQNQVFYKPICT